MDPVELFAEPVRERYRTDSSLSTSLRMYKSVDINVEQLSDEHFKKLKSLMPNGIQFDGVRADLLYLDPPKFARGSRGVWYIQYTKIG